MLMYTFINCNVVGISYNCVYIFCRENCDKQSARVLRQFYRRPYFVPPNVELAYTNWIFVASHYNGTDPKPVSYLHCQPAFIKFRQ